MQVLVRYFQNLREIASTDAERIQLDEGATVRDLKARLACLHEDLISHLSMLMITLNEAVPNEDHRLQEGDTIDIMPPEGKC
ncbi:hypothetical protein CVU37_07505 [candidate division BRC1 bacterium HGW-BRC1-1]|jgi:molybdopterin converting factor small subunit|nr:MAG: hypothetical protein CVU37_07505 [candidate division BRC1 bacterium HGW-BRC1-1]